MKPGAAYYAGGFRVVICGVPLRVARKPSAHDLAWMRKDAAEREKDYVGRAKWERDEYARRRAKQAREAIETYATMLEISVTQAKARILRQRQHLAANPLVDMSLEYDL